MPCLCATCKSFMVEADADCPIIVHIVVILKHIVVISVIGGYFYLYQTRVAKASGGNTTIGFLLWKAHSFLGI